MPDSADPLDGRIFRLRSHRLILDADLARLYGTTTKRLNEQVRRNRQRFPEDFAFQLTHEETLNLKSQIATSSLETINKEQHAHMWSKIATSWERSSYGGRRKLPWAFTEH